MEGTITKTRVCWVVLLFALLTIEAVGIYLLKVALDDPQSKEISSLDDTLRIWNKTRTDFQGIKVAVSNYTLSTNLTQTWGETVEKFPKYPVTFYSGYVNVSAGENAFSVEAAALGKAYNITTDLEITVVDKDKNHYKNVIKGAIVYSRKKSTSNFKNCLNENMGYWDSSSSTCYHDFHTTKFCFVLARNFSLVDWYATGCDSTSYYEQKIHRWRKEEGVKNVSLSISTEARSEKDPYVYASYNGLIEFSASSKEYKIAGITLVVISSALIGVWTYLICCSKSKRKYITMDDLSKI